MLYSPLPRSWTAPVPSMFGSATPPACAPASPAAAAAALSKGEGSWPATDDWRSSDWALPAPPVPSSKMASFPLRCADATLTRTCAPPCDTLFPNWSFDSTWNVVGSPTTPNTASSALNALWSPAASAAAET